MTTESETASRSASNSWELTGNHSVAAPAIAMRDGSIHQLNVVHRGVGGLVSWSGEAQARPDGDPLFRLKLGLDGSLRELDDLQWERIDRWIPRWRAQPAEDLTATGTVCFPGGADAGLRGGVLAIELHNRGRSDRSVDVVLECRWRYSLLTVATTRPLTGPNRIVRGSLSEGIALEATHGGHAPALAVATTPGATYRGGLGVDARETLEAGGEVAAANGEVLRFDVAHGIHVPAGRQVTVTFCFGVGPDRDGALATADHLCRLGAEELIRVARLDLTRITRKTGDPATAALLNRNLIYAFYAGVGRALDDDRMYLLRSRSPQHGSCASFNEREALLWLLPALTAADQYVGREALLRAFEQYAHRPGERSRYLDGGVLAPGFCLDQACAYAVALDRYTAETREASLLEEPLVQDVLRELDEILFTRLDPEYFLCATELLPSGEKADYPYVSYDNALLWRFANSFPRIWRRRGGDRAPRFEKASEEIGAALWQRCTAEVDGMRVIGYAADLRGGVAIYDDPAGSLRLLPHLGFCEVDDPIWSNTMELLHSPAYPLWHGKRAYPGFAGRSRPDHASFATLAADLLTQHREDAIEILRRLDLDGGIAGEAYDPDTGRIVSGPFSAPLAGFLAWALLAEQQAPASPRPHEAQAV